MHKILDTVLRMWLLLSLAAGDVLRPQQVGGGGRWKREDTLLESSSVSSTEENNLPAEDLEPGPTLGEILGTMTIVITIIYIFGISWKVLKIYRGEYEPKEPVYLKYK